jgi:hypothetical protein
VRAGTAARVAWSLCAVAIVGICGVVLLNVLNGSAGLGLWPQLGTTLAFSVVGALVAARQPRNRVGWLLLAVGLCLTMSYVSESYAQYVLVTAPGSLPGGLYASFLFLPYFGAVAILACFLPLYFPTGRLLSPRWRPVVWSGAALVVLAVVGNGLRPDVEPLPGLSPVHNPVAYLPAAKPLLDLLIGLTAPCGLVGLGGAVAALVVRFRRATGIERQQLKWFTYAAALTPLPFIIYEVAPGVFQLLFTLALPLVPISVGIAILRNRLYEIDRIINRTLVYGLLTAVLGLGYAAGSLVFVLLAGPGSDPPSWLVAAATLAAAAVFRPARRRIQNVVDRRFNRRRYDAAKTIETFSARLREELDLDSLGRAACGGRSDDATDHRIPVAAAISPAAKEHRDLNCPERSDDKTLTRGPRAARRRREVKGETPGQRWGDRRDLNPRPSGPQPDALTN